MDVKVIESLSVDVLNSGFTLRVNGKTSTERHSDWTHYTEAFTSKKELIKFLDLALEA